MAPFIELESLCCSYQRPDGKPQQALRNIDLKIGKGEFVAILGANGSGKSTLAKHLNALLLPTSGCCRVGGLDTAVPENLWTIRQQVGMVFQNPDNQIVAAIVEEDVAFGPENLGLPPQQIRQRVDSALACVGMTEFRQHGPHLLSGGQKQRVAIAGVLAMRPSCMVLDEPTAMLDPTGRNEVIRSVCELHRTEGMTVVYITHYMEEAILADRIIVMSNGTIALDGTPAEVFTQGDVLGNCGLEVPVAVELAEALRRHGIPLATDILTAEQLAGALCR